MGKFLTILLFYLCSASFMQSADLSSSAAKSGCEQIASRYVEQIDCQRQCNNFAHRSEQISIPSTSVTTAAEKSYQPRVAVIGDNLHSLCVVNYYCTRFSLYRLCGRRAIDYYLYTLCRLRLWFGRCKAADLQAIKPTKQNKSQTY